MTTQSTLFDLHREPLLPEARARHSDPETSHLAAASVDVTRSQRLVLDMLRQPPYSPVTADYLARLLIGQVPPSRVRGALSELVKRGLVVVAGRRENKLGNMAQTYRVV